MLILDTATRSLEIDLNAVVTTNQLPFVASYVDIAKTTAEVVASASNTGQSNSTTAVTLVAAPGANQTRHLKYLSVRNADTVATLMWIQVNDNSTLREIWKGTLAVGDSLIYTDSLGFNVINTSGQIKTGSGISSIGTSTDNALVRWDGTGGTAIQNSGWTLADTNVLTAGDNLAMGANYISNTGTDAGLSFDGSNNATLSGGLTVTLNTILSGSLTLSAGSMSLAQNQTITLSGGSGTNYGRLSYSASGNTTSYFDNAFDDAGAEISFRTRTLGTPVNCLILTSTTATLSGTLTVSGAGPHAIGTTTITNASLNANLPATASSGKAVGLNLGWTLTAAANSDVLVGAASGLLSLETVYATVTYTGLTASMVELTGTGMSKTGTGTIDNAAAIRIVNAPTIGTNNYALWVDAGTVRIDGTTGAGASVGTLTNAPSAGDPAYWMPVNANGTTYYIPCWT